MPSLWSANAITNKRYQYVQWMALAGDVVSAIPTKVYDTRVFFSKSRPSPFKSGSFSCISGPVTDAAREAQITEKRAIQMHQYFRDVCSWRLVNYDPPIALGGTGIVVIIDESLFCHKVKVNKSQRGVKAYPACPPPPKKSCISVRYLIYIIFYRGRAPATEIWVFGMVDISHTPALGYMEIVAQRDAATLPNVSLSQGCESFCQFCGSSDRSTH